MQVDIFKKKKEEETDINQINLDRIQQAAIDSKTMVQKQEAGWRKQQTQRNKLALQQSLYKTKIGTVV